MAGKPKYERGRMKQLILLLAQRSKDDPGFGAVNKLLYFCDFEAFRVLGRPLTGARYQKEQYGPLAPATVHLQDEMVGDGQISIETRRVGKHKQAVTVAIHNPDPKAFDESELEVIEGVLKRLRGMGAVDASEYSHERSAGWRMVDEGQTIPYSSAILSTEPPPPEVIKHFQQLHGIAS